MKFRFLVVAVCCAFAVLASGALFVSSIYAAPRVLTIIGATWALSSAAMLLILGLVGGLLAGMPFGLSFGFIPFSRPVSYALLTSAGAVLILTLYRWMLGYGDLSNSRQEVLASIAAAEGLFFVLSFTSIAKLTHFYAKSIQPKARIISALLILLLLLVVFHRIFSIYIPGIIFRT